MYQFFPYIIFSFVSIFMLLFLAVYAFLNRHNLVVVNEFIFTALAGAWWTFCQAFELMALTLPVKLFWANLLYIGAGLTALAYLMLSLRHTGYDKLLTKRNITIVLFIYALFIFLFFTDSYHGLMRTNFSLDTSAVPFIIEKDYGMLFPLYMLFTYALNFTTIILLFVMVIKRDSIYRKQAAALLTGVSITAISNLAYILGLSPVNRFEITPALFWFSALIISWGIFGHKLLNVMPIARDMLLERIRSGIIVVDSNNVLADINGAALQMFELQKSEVVGHKVSDIPTLAQNLPTGESGKPIPITYSSAGEECFYEIKRHPLEDNKSRKAGTLWVIEDITDRQRNLEMIVRQEKTLSVMRERERLGRTLHDGLGQVFGYFNTQGQAVREYMIQGKNDKALQHLSDLIAVSREHHHNVREHISDIRGVSVENKSFSAALKQYAAGFVEKYSIPVEISFDEQIPVNFPHDTAGVELIKIIQEALNNVQKHAGACSVKISFNKKMGFTELSISDDGAGFDPLGYAGKDSYGLSIMRERAAEIGASMAINSQTGKGTDIILLIRD